MAYIYETERESLFTEEGQRLFLKIRDQVNYHIKESGAVRADKAWQGLSGSTFQFSACFDRMIELGEIICLSPKDTWGQYKIYTVGIRQ